MLMYTTSHCGKVQANVEIKMDPEMGRGSRSEVGWVVWVVVVVGISSGRCCLHVLHLIYVH